MNPTLSLLIVFSVFLVIVACGDSEPDVADLGPEDLVAQDGIQDPDALADQTSDPQEEPPPDQDAVSDIEPEPDVVEPPDRDGDGVPDDEDRFPDDPCEATDMDGDGIGDASDPDRDGDDVDDRWERRVGTDPNDGEDFPAETDTDGDEVPDYRDPFPLDETRSEDLDGDGLADDEDPDDDDDLVPDDEEILLETDPRGLIPHETCALGHQPGWYPGDLHAHTNYSEDARQQGGDDIDVWVDILEYYEDPRFLAVHPEYEGRGLRFQAITDHRTVDGAFDPDFHSDRVVLIPGEEIGGPQHGNGLNLLTHVDHHPRGGETYSERMRTATDQIHWQGGLFQPNHPTYPGLLWTTAIEGLDSIEVWNAVWGVIKGGTEEDLNRTVPARGEENPFIRPALRNVPLNANQQTLSVWEYMLTAGKFVTPVGGGDRHMIFPPAHPTTWVWVERLTADDVLDGVRRGRTVITRHPGAVRLEVYLHTNDRDEPVWLGDEVIVGPETEITLDLRMEHGSGTTIQVIAGAILADPTPEALLEAPPGEVLLTQTVSEDAADPYLWTTPIEPPVPGWIYLRVLEPIRLDGLSDQSVEILEEAIEQIKVGVEDYFEFVDILQPFAPLRELAGLIPCQEENWTAEEELNFECFLVDQDLLYTFLMPEEIDLILNYWRGEGPDGDWALGALTSAFMFR